MTRLKSHERAYVVLRLNETASAKVDISDVWVAEHHWWCIGGGGSQYAATRVRLEDGKVQFVLLHRMLLGEPADGKVVDHINGDPFDNRRHNLRIVDYSINARNVGSARRNNTSGIRGVRFNKSSGTWYADITIGEKRHHIGSYSTREAAAVARALAEKELIGIEPRRAEEIHYWINYGIDPEAFRLERKPFAKRAGAVQ